MASEPGGPPQRKSGHSPSLSACHYSSHTEDRCWLHSSRAPNLPFLPSVPFPLPPQRAPHMPARGLKDPHLPFSTCRRRSLRHCWSQGPQGATNRALPVGGSHLDPAPYHHPLQVIFKTFSIQYVKLPCVCMRVKNVANSRNLPFPLTPVAANTGPPSHALLLTSPACRLFPLLPQTPLAQIFRPLAP